MNTVKNLLQNFFYKIKSADPRVKKVGVSMSILLIIPLTIFALQYTQVFKSRAATAPGSYGYGNFGENVYGTFTVASPSATIAPSITVNPTNTITPTTTSTPSPTHGITPSPTTPVPTIPPGNTSLSLKLILHGVGKGGDNVNPNGGGNPNPGRPQRDVTVEIYNTQEQLVLTKTGSVRFNSTEGNFAGAIDIGTSIPTGVYNVKVKSSQFLKTIIPGIHTITRGQVNNLPQAVLKTADMNDDNKIDILDYKILDDCYGSDITPAADCSSQAKKASADITDDGEVNQFDYNLYLREVANQVGD